MSSMIIAKRSPEYDRCYLFKYDGTNGEEIAKQLTELFCTDTVYLTHTAYVNPRTGVLLLKQYSMVGPREVSVFAGHYLRADYWGNLINVGPRSDVDKLYIIEYAEEPA